MTIPPRLAELGWDAEWQEAADRASLEIHASPGRPGLGGQPRPGRVLLQGRHAWHVGLAHADLVVRAHRSSGPPARRAVELVPDPRGDVPVTGDWLLLDGDDSQPRIATLLPRRTSLTRAATDGRSEQQVLAANADIVGICAPADDLNPRRLERELVTAWQSGGTPLVILTKADLVDEIDEPLAVAAQAAPGTDIVAVTVADPRSLEPVRDALALGRTLALIGASGTGKSTLANGLAGTDVQRTAGIRADGRGRHTTTTRRLVRVRGGGLVLDTPGLRAIAPWTDPEGLAAAFADIDALSGHCRFRDCAHETEPGCAVRSAVQQGTLAPERWHAWQSLQREQAWLARRSDARLMSEERRRWAAVTRSARHRIRP